MYASGRSQRLRARRMPIVGDKREPVPWKAASPPGAKDAASMERDHTRSRHSFRQATAHAFRRVPQFILGTRRLIPRETDTHRSRESSGELVAEANGKHPMPCHAAAGARQGMATAEPHYTHRTAVHSSPRHAQCSPCPALPCPVYDLSPIVAGISRIDHHVLLSYKSTNTILCAANVVSF